MKRALVIILLIGSTASTAAMAATMAPPLNPFDECLRLLQPKPEIPPSLYHFLSRDFVQFKIGLVDGIDMTDAAVAIGETLTNRFGIPQSAFAFSSGKKELELYVLTGDDSHGVEFAQHATRIVTLPYISSVTKRGFSRAELK